MFFCLLCHGVNRPDQDLCATCLQELPWNQHHCQRCAEPWPEPFAAPFEGLCQHCVSDEPHFDQCFTPFIYRFPVDQLLLQGKGSKRAELLFVLARLFANDIRRKAVALPDLILPVPLHPQKQHSRGYNQAGVLAHLVGRKLGIPVRHDLITKVREPKQQKTLSRSGRQQNIQRAFRIERQALKNLPHPAHHIALIDDVITTGSTLNQLAKQLRSSGVERVDGWAMARTAKIQAKPT